MSKCSVAASRLESIPTQIPTLVDQPPEGEGWIHEVKFGRRLPISICPADGFLVHRAGAIEIASICNIWRSSPNRALAFAAADFVLHGFAKRDDFCLSDATHATHLFAASLSVSSLARNIAVVGSRLFFSHSAIASSSCRFCSQTLATSVSPAAFAAAMRMV